MNCSPGPLTNLEINIWYIWYLVYFFGKWCIGKLRRNISWIAQKGSSALKKFKQSKLQSVALFNICDMWQCVDRWFWQGISTCSPILWASCVTWPSVSRGWTILGELVVVCRCGPPSFWWLWVVEDDGAFFSSSIINIFPFWIHSNDLFSAVEHFLLRKRKTFAFLMLKEM